MNAIDYVDGMTALGFALHVTRLDPDKPTGVLTLFPVKMPAGKANERWHALEAWRRAICTTAELVSAIVARPTATRKSA